MDEHVLPTYQRSEEVFVSGRGAWLVDQSGREYLDFLAGIAVNALGHAHEGLMEALRDQVGRLVHTSNLIRHPYTEPVAERLTRLAGMQAAFFCNSGSEANETAIKISRKVQRLRGKPHRTSFVALAGSFHGRTIGAVSLTSKEAYRAPFGPLLDVTFVEPEDEAMLAAALAKEPAALFVEPIQGEGGMRELSARYLQKARELCTKTGTLLVHDEVQCGAGRTGRFLAGDHAGVRPDVVTLAKPIGGGLPMGTTLVSAEHAQCFTVGEHGSTFGGGPMVLRAALVFLEALEEGGLQQNVAERGAELARGLEELVAVYPIARARRGRGLMQALVVPERASELVKALRRHGLLACSAGSDVVRFLPPFVVRAEDVRRGLTLIRDALDELSSRSAP
jgi:predicted acetylornithine/succinylornithine family transaminase